MALFTAPFAYNYTANIVAVVESMRFGFGIVMRW
jgi:hypothetical protein